MTLKIREIKVSKINENSKLFFNYKLFFKKHKIKVLYSHKKRNSKKNQTRLLQTSIIKKFKFFPLAIHNICMSNNENNPIFVLKCQGGINFGLQSANRKSHKLNKEFDKKNSRTISFQTKKKITKKLVIEKHTVPLSSNANLSEKKLFLLQDTKKRVLDAIYKFDKKVSVHLLYRHLNTSKSNIYYHLKGLKKIGLIKDNGKFGVIRITQKGKKYVNHPEKSLVGYERQLQTKNTKKNQKNSVENSDEWLKKDRLHNLKVLIKVLQIPKNRDWLKSWDNYKMKNNIFHTSYFGDIHLTFTGKNIICQLPPLLFRNSDVAIAEGLRITRLIAIKLQKENKGLNLGELKHELQVMTQHNAIPNDPYAKWCYENNITYKDDVLELDGSNGTPELEFVSKFSNEHHSNYVEFIRDIVLTKSPKYSDLSKIVGTMQNQLIELSRQNQSIQKQQELLVQNQINLTEQLTILTNQSIQKNKNNMNDNKIDSPSWSW